MVSPSSPLQHSNTCGRNLRSYYQWRMALLVILTTQVQRWFFLLFLGVSLGSKGQYLCDCNCLNWVTSGVYSHSIAVAELNHDLDKFLLCYNSEAPEPDITSLASTGLPSGRGRKGGTARQKPPQKGKYCKAKCIMKGKTLIECECVRSKDKLLCPLHVWMWHW